MRLHTKVNGGVPDADTVNDAAPPSATVTFCGWAVIAGATAAGSVDTRLVGLQAPKPLPKNCGRTFRSNSAWSVGVKSNDVAALTSVNVGASAAMEIVERDIIEVPAFRATAEGASRPGVLDPESQLEVLTGELAERHGSVVERRVARRLLGVDGIPGDAVVRRDLDDGRDVVQHELARVLKVSWLFALGTSVRFNVSVCCPLPATPPAWPVVRRNADVPVAAKFVLIGS